MKKRIFFYIILCFIPVISFANSTDTTKIISWKVTETNDTIATPIDTLLFEFQHYHPSFINSFSNSATSSNGQATISNIFESTNSSENEPYFIKYLWPYITTISDVKFYNTKNPYTEVLFSSGPKKDHTLKVLHTQNINKSFNFSLLYNLAALEGNLKRQRVRDNSAAISTSYTGIRYSQHSSIIWNKFKIVTNGGILADTLFENSTESPQALEVLLNNAYTNIDKRSVYLMQKINFLKYFSPDDSSRKSPLFRSSLSHSIRYDFSSRTYNDARSDFYQQWNIDSLNTKDSLFFKTLENKLFYKINDYGFLGMPIGLKFGVSHEMSQYGFTEFDTTYTNTSIEAALFNESSQSINFEIKGQYYFSGYQKGYVSANAVLKKYFTKKQDSCWIAFSGAFNQGQPDIYLKKYYSNNFKWDSAFQKVTNSRARIDFTSKKLKLKLSAVYSILDNLIFFDTLAMPRQYESDINVVSFLINKNFTIWKIHLNNYIVYQKPSKDFVRVPDVVLYHSLYIHFNAFDKKLPTNIGFDVFYNSYYHGNAYMPATNIFYMQNDRKIGGHPYVDFFISAQRKDVRFFLKAEHVSAFLSKRNYYSTPHYPANGFGIRFGISWRFSD